MTSTKKPKPADETIPVPQISTWRKHPLKTHPWDVTIKDYNSNRILRAHNSVRNPVYPKPKEGRKPFANRITFTVIGQWATKEFIYCIQMVQGMHKYRSQSFGAPIIQGVTGVEWPFILKELQYDHGEEVLCLRGPVAVLENYRLLGGVKELKDLIEGRYIYHLALNYARESIDLFKHFVKKTGRACAYMHIAVDEKPMGCLMFMLYSDIVPYTCENFLRLCQTTNGGYSGTPVHRIVEDGWIQCGGFGLKDAPLGCENFIVPHDRRGVLGMCNADRGIDCSTQFFVLLQPAHWMNHKYVAFGQLIDGEETLKKIEEIPTFYDSPTKNIVIFKAGILNMECDDIMINRGAVAYIDGHIEDLIPLGEMLYEWLMELVALEIQFRYLKSLDPQTGEGGDLQPTDSSKIKNVTAPPSRSSNKDDHENNDFDVEGYQANEFEGEAYSYDRITISSSKVIEKRPYYIPLTDVPYPGERDSNFDLKRFLQGNYCLHADLDSEQPKFVDKTREKRKDQVSHIMVSYIYSSVHNVLEPKEEQYSMLPNDFEFSHDIENLDDEDKEIVQEYLRNNIDKVSFAGEVVSHIGKVIFKDSHSKSPMETFTDDEIRRIRMALQDLRSDKLKTVKIHDKEKFETKYYLKKTEEESNDHKDVDTEKHGVSKVVIREPFEKMSPHKIRRRQTGYIKQEDLDLVNEMSPEEDKKEKPQVRIAKSLTEHEVPKWYVKSSASKTRRASTSQEYDDVRPSVLLRLYDDVAVNDDEKPTLKDFKSNDTGLKNDSFMLLSDSISKGLLRKSRRLITDDEDTVQAVELKRFSFSASNHKRPTMTVSAYRKKNQLYAEKLKVDQAKKEKL